MLRIWLLSLFWTFLAMPVASAQLQNVNERTGWVRGDFIPVDLKCPGRNNGILEMTWREYHGVRSVRTRVRFVSELAESVSVAATDRTHVPLLDVVSEKSAIARSPKEATAIQEVKSIASAIKENVCDASQSQRDRFFALLKISSPLLRGYWHDAQATRDHQAE